MSLHSLAVFALSFRRMQNAKKYRSESFERRQRSRSITIIEEEFKNNNENDEIFSSSYGTAAGVVAATDQILVGLFPGLVPTKKCSSYNNLRNINAADEGKNSPKISNKNKKSPKRKLLENAKRRRSLAVSASHILSPPSTSSVNETGVSVDECSHSSFRNNKNSPTNAANTNNGFLNIANINEIDNNRRNSTSSPGRSPSRHRNLLEIFKRKTSELIGSSTNDQKCTLETKLDAADETLEVC